MKNHYQTLGVEPNASREEIKKAYRQYVKKFHPDLHNDDKFFEERFKDVQEAYEIVFDEIKREDYDEEFYGASRAEINQEDFEKAIREEYENKFREQQETFAKRERRIYEEFSANSGDASGHKAGNAMPQNVVDNSVKQTKSGQSFPLVWFFIIQLLLITIPLILIWNESLIGLWLVAYYATSLVIIQNDLGLKWMLVNFFVLGVGPLLLVLALWLS